MKKFRSRLDTLLKIRKKEEKEAKKKLMSIFRHLRHLWNRQHDLEQEIQKVSKRFQKNEEILFSVEQANAAYDYVAKLTEEVGFVNNEIEAMMKQLDQGRDEVIEAMKQSKVIENIEQKEKDAWLKETEKREERFFDEITTSNYLRRKKEFDQQLKDKHEPSEPDT